VRVQLRPVPDTGGCFDAAAVHRAAADADQHLPPLSAVAIENTYMAAGGRPWRPVEVRGVADAAHHHQLGVHCDGARIWNASVALGVSPRDLCDPVDTVMFCLSKGLGAPIGSLLCGPRDVIDVARDERARLGGGWRQAGIIAAAGLVALETMVDRLADDHERARRLADALAARFPGSVDPATVETNIVCAAADRLPVGVVDRLAARGVRCGMIDAVTVRFVTHHDVGDEELDRAIAALDALLKEDS